MWTIEQMKEMDDLSFAIAILNERRNKLTNVYSPLSIKLTKSIQALERLKGKEGSE